MAEPHDPLLNNDQGENDSHEMKVMKRKNGDKEKTGPAAGSRICSLVKKGKQTNVDDLLDAIKTCSVEDVNSRYSEEDKTTPLLVAALNGEVEVVKILLEAGAHIKYKDSKGQNALHYAVWGSSEEAFEVFKLILPTREELASRKACDNSSLCKCKRHRRSGVDCWMDIATSPDDDGLNVLDLALKKISASRVKTTYNDTLRNIVEYLVKETELHCFLRLMRNKDSNFSTPMRKLIEKTPESAKLVLDRCVEEKSGSISIHYELLDDMYLIETWPKTQEDYCEKYYQYEWEKFPSKDKHTQSTAYQRLKSVLFDKMEDVQGCKPYTKGTKTMKNNHPLMLMIEKKQNDTRDEGIYQELFDHPVVQTLVRQKWNHIGIKFHALNLVFYMFFLVSFTVCVTTATPPYAHSSNGNTGSLNESDVPTNTVAMCQNETDCQSSALRHARNSDKLLVFVAGKGSAMVFVLSLIMIVKEVYQMVWMYGCREYWSHKHNYVELGVFLSAILFVLNITGRKDIGYTGKNWHWLLGTFSLFFAWINLLSFLKKFEVFGIYVMMLWKIITTFLKNIGLIVAILITAFAISFNSVRRDQEEFDNFGRALLKTASLMVAGFEYEPDEFKSLAEMHYDVINATYIFYSLFLVLMTIIIINLMVGVAVDNVQDMFREAMVSNCIFQIEYVLEFEGYMSYWSERLTCLASLKKWFLLNPTEEIWTRKVKQYTQGLPAITVKAMLKLIKKDKNCNKLKKEDICDLRTRLDNNTTELASIKEELVNMRKALEARR